jgi:competence ComEA-like helix-hairpin-helix protein
VKNRKRIVIIILCLIISVTLSIFALNLNATSSTTDNNFVLNQSLTHSKQPDSISHHNRTFYNIQTKRPTPLIELNTADTLDLQVLKGVGQSYARRIYKYRILLGGFRSVEQIKEVYGMTKELYELLLPQITIDTSQIQKLNINTASIKELNHHPYIDYYLAKAIVKYRITEGNFHSLEELQAIYLFDDSTFAKILPYITL